MLISNRPSLYYEILLSLEKKGESFFLLNPEPFQERNDGATEHAFQEHFPIFLIGPAHIEVFLGFRRFSIGS